MSTSSSCRPMLVAAGLSLALAACDSGSAVERECRDGVSETHFGGKALEVKKFVVLDTKMIDNMRAAQDRRFMLVRAKFRSLGCIGGDDKLQDKPECRTPEAMGWVGFWDAMKNCTRVVEAKECAFLRFAPPAPAAEQAALCVKSPYMGARLTTLIPPL